MAILSIAIKAANSPARRADKTACSRLVKEVKSLLSHYSLATLSGGLNFIVATAWDGWKEDLRKATKEHRDVLVVANEGEREYVNFLNGEETTKERATEILSVKKG